MAALGSYERVGIRSSTVGIVKNTPVILVKDAFLGECCTSLKKICGIVKKHILKDGESFAM